MQGWVAAVTGKDNCVRALQAPETLNFYDLEAGHLLAAFLEALLGNPRRATTSLEIKAFNIF